MDNSIHSQNLSAVEAELKQAVDEMKTAFAVVRRLERGLSAKNYEEVMPNLYQERQIFLSVVRRFKECLGNGGELRDQDAVNYLAFANCEVPDLAIIDSSHRLVRLRVALIEAWFMLKKCSADHPLYLTRKKDFLVAVENALTALKKPMEFDEMYELFADDLSKLRSLLVSYFRKKSEKWYVEEFNRYAKASFQSRGEVSLLLREFALFFDYKAVN